MYTKGPWKVETWTYENGKRSVPTITNGQDAVAQTVSLYRHPAARTVGEDEKAANARRIVLCVNAHDELLEALELAADFVYGCHDAGARDAWEKVVTVIAKARGE